MVDAVNAWGNDETIFIRHDEVIVGFKAKSKPESPAVYTEWQFITARGLILFIINLIIY